MAIITLTSDIGKTDYLPGAVKGKLFSLLTSPVIVDITHELQPFNILQAAYICKNTYLHYPENTYHIVLANLFDQQTTNLIVAKNKNRYILCADNGLIEMVIGEAPEKAIKLLSLKPENKNILSIVTSFANAIKQLEEGKQMEDIGIIKSDYIKYNLFRPAEGDNWIERPIIFIDNFENIIVDLTREEFERERKNRAFQIIFRREEFIDKISHSYADVAEGEKVAFFNTAGYLEIAVNKGNAAGLFGLKSFSEFQQYSIGPTTMYQSIKIQFINEK